MLTPAFELSQDENSVTVVIKTPYVKISEVDFHIDGREFKFHVKPYFLRLNLPGKIIEDGREEASYDIEKGTFTVVLPKLQYGEYFEGLDLLTSLLAPTKKDNSYNKPLIEVLNDNLESVKPYEPNVYSDEDEEFNWEIEQELPKDDVTMTVNKHEGKYGFANKKAGLFYKRQEELYEIADVPDPESTTLRERRLARMAAEDFKFDPDHYLADYFDEETIQPYLDYSPPWNQEYKDTDLKEAKEKAIVFTEEERDKLRHFPNKEYLLDEKVIQSSLLGLVDIIFAYAYNHRTTEGENTVESPWTINKLSSTFCYFETFTNINDVLVASFRRCLSYPLYRHWKLAECVLEDTRRIFKHGRKRLMKCLLEIHGLFNGDDPRFLLNDLYVTDYCVWLQTASGKKLHSLAKTLQKTKISKKDIGWQLEELEHAAVLVAGEESSESSSTDTSDSEDSEDTDSNEKDEKEIDIKIGNLSLTDNPVNADNNFESNATKPKIVVLNSSEF